MRYRKGVPFFDAGVAHLDRALPCQGRGSGFKSRHSLHKKILILLRKSLQYFSCLCLGDGTGRHARLKIWWLHGRAGSSPALGKDQKSDEKLRFFLFKKYFPYDDRDDFLNMSCFLLKNDYTYSIRFSFYT